MNTIEPVEDRGHADAWERPFMVKVNGEILMNKQLNPRRFKTSIAAAIAGAKYVDELKKQSSNA